jgi:hypothetical protein
VSRKTEIALFTALLAVLAFVLYRNFVPAGDDSDSGPQVIAIQPLHLPNPELHLGRIERLRQMTYSGMHRNIFSDTAPPPSVPQKVKLADGPGVRGGSRPSAGPPPPPHLVVPLTFYGTAVDPRSGGKAAFFTNGDHVYIASQGQTLLGHFRLLQIGDKTVTIEDTGSGETATLVMTPPVTR